MLGTYGVPAAYSGFESAVVNIGGYLRDRGWRVVVYCQLLGVGPIEVDRYEGLDRVLVQEPRTGVSGRAHYDLVAARHAVQHHGPEEVCLTFGYNTGVLGVLQAARRIPHVVNMDGMDWQRTRYGLLQRAALRSNEAAAGVLATRLVGDHPVVADYLRRHYGRPRVQMIPYGADAITGAPTLPVQALGLRPGAFATVICRPLPENSVLEIVTAWSRRPRGVTLVVLGEYDLEDGFQRSVRTAAGEEVRFIGPVFEAERVASLRVHSRLYLHGHTVGGTNPSLVEAMAAGNAVVAKDNRYNRWVAGRSARYFHDVDDLDLLLTELLDDEQARAELAVAARERHAESFTTQQVGSAYEAVLRECLD